MSEIQESHDADGATNARPAHTAFRSDVADQLIALDRTIATVKSDEALGSTLLQRALLRQGDDDPAIPAADAVDALRRLRRTERRDEAALAAAVAAGMTFRTDDVETAIDLAVDAMVLVDGHHRSDLAARALNSLAIVFMQISAFEQALNFSLRALAALGSDSDQIGDVVRFTHCALLFDAHHAGIELPLESGRWAAAALRSSNDELTRRLVGPGAAAELSLIETPGLAASIELDESAVDLAAARMAGWFRVLLADIHHRRGDHQRAGAFLDRAIPDLALLRDDHRLARAHTLRSRVREELGDQAGALADARARGDIVQKWQTQQVGRLAWQIAQRAELERNQRRLEARASELAEEIDVDALTGVGSRRLLDVTLDELAMSQPGRVGVVVIDLDHFKEVNDTLGHSAGDAVLRRVGEILREAARPHDLVARLGGEEFVAVFPDAGSDRAQEYADEVRTRLAAADWDDVAPGTRVRASAGVATGQISDVRVVLERADDALYQAKRRGRDRSVTA